MAISADGKQPRIPLACALISAAALLFSGCGVSADDLQSSSRAASGDGAWGSVRSLHIVSEVQGSGLKGTSERWLDVRRGLFVSASTLDNRAEGFDGHRTWTRDAGGQVWVQDTPETREASADESYRAALAFWFPERHRAKLETEPPISQAGDLYDVVRVVPEGGRPFQFWLSRRTHRIARMVERGGFYTRTEVYSDWRGYSGLLIPAVVITSITSPAGQLLETTKEIRRRIDVNPAVPARAFAAPPSRVDFSFPDGRSALSLPFQLVNNHIYVGAKVNRRPATLMFDTGATGILDPMTARRLGSDPQGEIAQTGVGRRVERGGFAKVETVDLGGLVLHHQTFTTQSETEFSQVEGLHVDGVIGFELPHRVVVKLDYVHRRMELIRTEAFRIPAGYADVPIRFLVQIPVVRARVNGVPADFAVDSGSRASLVLLGGLARRPEFSAAPQLLRNAVVGWGTGGAARGDVGRAKRFEIAGWTIDEPVTVLMPQGPPVDGNIGGGVLRKFDVILDYPHGKIWLKKNSAADMADAYDRAGLWLNRTGRDFSVMDVVPNSPAAAAGIKVGDRITAFNGVPVFSLALADIRARLKADPGTAIALEIRRGRITKTVRFELASLI